MAYTTDQLITESFYLSGVLSKDLQTISGSQKSEGLRLLNAVLAIKTANERLIPYFTTYDFDAVQGQERYFIANLITVETFTFYLGDVRFSMSPVSRKNYFGSSRAENVESLPFNWHIERTKGGSYLYLYFFPNEDYPLQITGKFALSSVTLGQDLELTLDKFYIEYLRYALAEYICDEYSITLPPGAAKKLAMYEKIIMDVSPPDLTISRISAFTGRPMLNWGDVNLGRGWRPG
jgi:hypothetical protein